MEPHFNLSQVNIIFGDQLIKHGLLVALGIHDTYLLHPDFYHLTNEMWPKSENFGTVLYSRIKNFLEIMLKSITEAELKPLWQWLIMHLANVATWNPSMMITSIMVVSLAHTWQSWFSRFCTC
jgi:hypothetical protein